MFEWAYDLNGSKVPIVKPLPVPAATVVRQGEIVDFTPGTGVINLGADGVDFDGPAVGVAINAHPANSGTVLKVSASPTAVYRHNCAEILTATGGNATTFVVATLVPATNNLWVGGMLEVVTCAADPSMVGKRIPITASFRRPTRSWRLASRLALSAINLSVFSMPAFSCTILF